MNRLQRASIVGVAALGVALWLTGCMTSAPTHHYTLTALAPPPPPGLETERTLGVGPLRLPLHLRQSALVRRTSAYRVTYGDFDLWADPVEDGVTEILMENLARLTGARRVVRHPWRPNEAPDRQLALEITAFELAADGQAELTARWEIRDAHGSLLESGETSRSESAGGQLDALAEALSRALLALSRDLAAALSRHSGR